MNTPLHVIHSTAALQRCLLRSDPDAVMILLGDAVYCGLAPQGQPMHVLLDDLAARGLSAADLAPGIAPIDMKGFVALTVAHSPVVGWF